MSLLELVTANDVAGVQTALLLHDDGGADLMSERDAYGCTALHVAASLGFFDVASILLGAGSAGIDSADNDGWTPLHEACKTGQVQSAGLLVSAGANLEHGGPGGALPLHIAAANGFPQLVQVLLGGGAVCDAPDDAGFTAVHHACVSGGVSVLRCLVEGGGASVTISGGDGRTPMQYATFNGEESQALQDMLLQYGAEPVSVGDSPEALRQPQPEPQPSASHTTQKWVHHPLNLLGFPDRFIKAKPVIMVDAGLCAESNFSQHSTHTFVTSESGATPPAVVHFFRVADPSALNMALADAVEAIRMQEAATDSFNVTRSNVGGFHSRDDILGEAAQAQFECLLDFAGLLHESVGQLGQSEPLHTVQSWANVNRRGHFNKLHDHGNAVWSGAYYVRVPHQMSRCIGDSPPATDDAATMGSAVAVDNPYNGLLALRTAANGEGRGGSDGWLAGEKEVWLATAVASDGGGADGALEQREAQPLAPAPEVDVEQTRRLDSKSTKATGQQSSAAASSVTFSLVKPEEGLLVIFPGMLKHAVLPSTSDGDRLSLSFNIDAVSNSINAR
jgi:ankyrin repeat protein